MKLANHIVTLTLNPAIDQSVTIPGFAAGEVNRVESEQADPGGKGVNVSCFLADLGFSSSTTGFVGIENSSIFERLFIRKSIADCFVRLSGKTRVNIKIIDERNHRITDINFPGQAARERDMELLRTKIESLIPYHDWFVLSGSLPEGVAVGFYAELITELKQAGKQVLLDSSGAALKLGVAAQPFALKPNIVELEEMLGKKLGNESAVADAARELVAGGIDNVVVSMGKQGAIFADAEQCLVAHPSNVDVKSTVGAGDAMVAGFIAGKLKQLPLDECARLATATAMGALTELGPNLPPSSVIESYMRRITLRIIR